MHKQNNNYDILTALSNSAFVTHKDYLNGSL